MVQLDNTSACSFSLSVNPAGSHFVSAVVMEMQLKFMVDTGAAVSLLSSRIWSTLGGEKVVQLSPWGGKQIIGVIGSPLMVLGVCTLDLRFTDIVIQTDFVVVDSLAVEAIIGLDFLESQGCVVDLPNKVLQVKGLLVPLERSQSMDDSQQISADVAVVETLFIPPFSEIQTMALCNPVIDHRTWLIEGSRADLPILIAGALVTSTPTGQGGYVPILIVNPLPTDVTIYEGTRVAKASPVESMMVAPVGEVPSRWSPTVPQVSSQKNIMLQKMVERSTSDLTADEKEELYRLLLEYADVFAESSVELGRTSLIKHSIDTGNEHPIRQPCRRVPPARREQCRDLIKDMLQKNIIQPSSSPWASPVVLVGKKDGSLRFCVDYRKLNAITRKDAYPLPRVDDSLEALSGSRWFSTLDLLSGYWQVEIDEKDRPKTAFTTGDGLFEFRVMPFGLCNAPAVFQRLMDLVLSGIRWEHCLVYIDDIIIMGKTFKDHLQNLRIVLERLRSAGLRLKPEKCSLFRDQVVFLGHVITRHGIGTDPDKTVTVKNWIVPTSTREVQRFLGLVGYYRRYIQDFSMIAKPLYRLTERGRAFEWTNECDAAFQELKKRLISAPVLVFPNFNKPFLLDTDGSETGVGAVLSQLSDDGQECVVAYGSRTLSKAERKYNVTRKELLAVVTFVKHFRPYLLGRHFVLRTDHSALQWIYSMKEPEGQLARWLEQLQEYDFEVVHRKGRNHLNADALSRVQGPTQKDSAGVFAVTPVAGNLQLLQQRDENIAPIIQAISSGKTLTSKDAEGKPREFNQFIQQWDQLVVENGILYRRYESSDGNTYLQAVAPREIREEIVQQLHAGAFGAHLGENKTLSRLKERFYWPGHSDDVIKWCKTCATCAARKNPSRRGRAPLQNVAAGYPMQIVAVDIVGPISPSTTGNTYILVASDYFTKWVEAYAIPNQEAVTVATKLVDEFFCRFSVPEQLHSDQGRQFESGVIQEVCRLLGIYKSRTTPYHPQSDGLVERFNRTLISMLATTVHNNPTDWELNLKKVCMAYNTSVHSSTGFSPFYLMFGRQAKLPIDIVYGSAPTEPELHHQYAKKLKQSLERAYSMARKHVGTAVERAKEAYNRKVHGASFEVGDLVWLNNPVVPRGVARKLHCPWSGPFKVVKRISPALYRIQDQRTSRSRRRSVVHFDRLKRCPQDVRVETTPTSDPTPRPLVTQPTGPEQALPPGTNLQYFEDDEPEEREPDGLRDQRIADRIEQRPPEEEVTVISPGRVGQEVVVSQQNDDRNVVDQKEAATDVQTSRYPKRDRRPPDFYGGFHW